MARGFKRNPNAEKLIREDIKQCLDKAAVVLQSQIKQNLSQGPSKTTLNVKTGNLRRNCQIDRSLIDSLRIKVGFNSVYASVHEFGKIIKIKTAKFLHYKINGLFHSTKSVVIPSRPFVRPAIYQCRDKILSIFKNSLDKY